MYAVGKVHVGERFLAGNSNWPHSINCRNSLSCSRLLFHRSRNEVQVKTRRASFSSPYGVITVFSRPLCHHGLTTKVLRFRWSVPMENLTNHDYLMLARKNTTHMTNGSKCFISPSWGAFCGLKLGARTLWWVAGLNEGAPFALCLYNLRDNSEWHLPCTLCSWNFSELSRHFKWIQVWIEGVSGF